MTIRLYLDLSSVIVGALSGALHAATRRFDVIGVMTIGIIGGLGGGLLRDVLVADGPPLALRHSVYLLTAAATTFLGLLFQGFVRRMQLAIWVLDTLVLGTFTVVAMDRAIAVGLPYSSSLFLGVIAGVGGTLIRDVVCRDVPSLLVRGEPYATASFFGGLVYLLAKVLAIVPPWEHWLPVLCVLLLRVAAAWRKWTVPDTDDVNRCMQRLGRRRSRREVG